MAKAVIKDKSLESWIWDTVPTARQGQFLAYIYQYDLIHGCAPAEADMQRYFQITPPSVHSMVLTLERRGFIRRVPGQGAQHRAGRATVVPASTATHPTLTLSKPMPDETNRRNQDLRRTRDLLLPKLLSPS